MNVLITIALKDLRLLFRDKMGLFFIFVFPVVYGIFFGSMYSGMGKKDSANLAVAIADEDNSAASAQFIKSLKDTGSVTITPLPRGDATDAVRRGEQLAFIAIPKGFGESAGAFWQSGPALDVGIDPARQAEAGFLEGLIMQASVTRMQEQFTNPALMRKQLQKAQKDINASKDLSTAQRFVFSTFFASLDKFTTEVNTNELKGGAKMEPVKINSVPVTRAKGEREELLDKIQSPFEISFPSAMVWGVMGCLAGFAISLVKERTEGTYLRLMASPLAQWQVITGKAGAFTCSAGVLCFMLLLGGMMFKVNISHVGALAAAIICISTCFVGLMMAASVIGKTEAAVSGATWAIMMIMAMIGGGMIPLVFLPKFMLTLSNISPIKWSILALEGAIWRDYSAAEMAMPCMILLGIGALGLVFASIRLSRAPT